MTLELREISSMSREVTDLFRAVVAWAYMDRGLLMKHVFLLYFLNF